MTTYAIDTDVLIGFFKKVEQEVKLISFLCDEGDFIISTITIAELRSGWTEKQAEFYLPLIKDFAEIKEIDIEIALVAGDLRQRYQKQQKNRIAVADALIAATAIVNDAVLVTRNLRDFPYKELKLYFS